MGIGKQRNNFDRGNTGLTQGQWEKMAIPPTDFFVFLEGCGPLLIRVWLRITHRDAGYKVRRNNLNFDATKTMTRFYEHKKTN
jgi:hypothetical protein